MITRIKRHWQTFKLRRMVYRSKIYSKGAQEFRALGLVVKAKYPEEDSMPTKAFLYFLARHKMISLRTKWRCLRADLKALKP